MPIKYNKTEKEKTNTKFLEIFKKYGSDFIEMENADIFRDFYIRYSDVSSFMKTKKTGESTYENIVRNQLFKEISDTSFKAFEKKLKIIAFNKVSDYFLSREITILNQ
jgi:hypothetical protein